MSQSTVPYIGSKISLVSNSEIRYEGILYTINTQESTIALQSVRCFGTEGRKMPEIPPSSEVYDFIIFRGQDIKDLTVLEACNAVNDPAIVSINQKPAGGKGAKGQAKGAPYGQQQQPGGGGFGGGFGGGGWGQAQQGGFGGGGWGQAQQGPQRAAAGGYGGQGYGGGGGWGSSWQGNWGGGGGGYGCGGGYSSGKGKSDGMGKGKGDSGKGKGSDSKGQKGYGCKGGKGDMGKGKGKSGKDSGKGGKDSGKGAPVGKGAGGGRGGRRGGGGAVANGQPVGELPPEENAEVKREFAEEFDVSAANDKFDKVQTIDGVDGVEERMKPLQGYEPAKSFFDSISCEATERAAESERQKVDRDKARQFDRETFGDTRRPPRPTGGRPGKGRRRGAAPRGYRS